MSDLEIKKIINLEKERQEYGLELIASENYVSQDVLETVGSILTNKYAEGYPSARYYGGCTFVDEVERLAIERVKELFNCKFANVQPHSGSQANAAVYLALLKPGDTILGMGLNAGGHLTHGYSLSFSGQFYKCYAYDLDKETEQLNYDAIEKLAQEVKPKLIVCGASAYSREIDFLRFRKIADKVRAYLMADIAHISAQVAVGLHSDAVKYADVVTTTTHKTLRGPRGGLILTNSEEIAKKINKAVFPGVQGGPLMHVIAGKAVCFKEALKPGFKTYVNQYIKNAKAMADEFRDLGYRVISGGTDNHIVLIDVKQKTGLTGLRAQEILEKGRITVNKNSIPFDTESPKYTSGIRLGSAALTTRGFKEEDFKEVVKLIDLILTNPENLKTIDEVRTRVSELCLKYPLNY